MKKNSLFPPIENYGIIGNCHTAALISSDGSIDWLCLPRFDSPSLFARILDLDRGGSWSIRPTNFSDRSRQYIYETNVLETIFTSAEGKISLIDFFDINSDAGQRAAPGRLIRLVRGIEGTVEIVSTFTPRPDYGRSLPDFDGDGNKITFNSFTVTSPTDWKIDCAAHTLVCRLSLKAGEEIAFTLMTQEALELPQPTPAEALKLTVDYWQRWANKCTYQGVYRETVIRSALTLQLMTYTPTGAIIAAPTTSLPEKIGGELNWDYRFTWIRDSSLTLYALLLAGYLEGEHPYFDWLARTMLKGSEINIIHPITERGELKEQKLEHLSGYRNSQPVRIGNQAAQQVQLDVYGEILSTLHFAWKTEKYDPSQIWKQIRPLLDWVARHWHEPDNGVWEIRGKKQHYVYSKVMLWVALNCGIEMAKAMELSGDTAWWQTEREKIRAEVFDKGWSEKLGAFKQSYENETLDASNLLLSIVGFIDGSDRRMISTIDATITHLVTNGLCYRYRQPDSEADSQEGAFVLCTFWLINSLIRAGRTSEAIAYYEGILARSSSLGLFAEELDPKTGAHLGNFPQAFSHLGVISVAVSLAHAGEVGTVRSHHVEAANAVGRCAGGIK
ncbi:glycoside hydrolase family 15 protein [Myxosarcina sp. GI1]|uniref:glycoside hydrolase family 15 protein n=1 Tax=Myxosarcina sp. GI1 TaxID=1541065 RepID=UPI00056D68E0|nr:glycoside hydrolase family 15 protein [Myxosarcina sp. GI1]